MAGMNNTTETTENETKKNQLLVWFISETGMRAYPYNINPEKPIEEETQKAFNAFFKLKIENNYQNYLKLIEKLNLIKKNINTTKESIETTTKSIETTEATIKKTEESIKTTEAKIANSNNLQKPGTPNNENDSMNDPEQLLKYYQQQLSQDKNTLNQLYTTAHTSKKTLKQQTSQLHELEDQGNLTDLDIRECLSNLMIDKKNTEQSYQQYNPQAIITEYTEEINQIFEQYKPIIKEIDELTETVQKEKTELASISNELASTSNETTKLEKQKTITDLDKKITKLKSQRNAFPSNLENKIKEFITKLKEQRPKTSNDRTSLQTLIANLENFITETNNLSTETIEIRDKNGNELQDQNNKVLTTVLKNLNLEDINKLQTVFESCFTNLGVLEEITPNELTKILEQINSSFKNALKSFFKPENQLTASESAQRREYLEVPKNNITASRQNAISKTKPFPLEKKLLEDLLKPGQPPQQPVPQESEVDKIFAALKNKCKEDNNENWNLTDLIAYITYLLANGGEKLKALTQQLTKNQKTLSADTLIIGAQNLHQDNEETPKTEEATEEAKVKKALNTLYKQYHTLKTANNLSTLAPLTQHNQQNNNIAKK